jgi:DNA-nicking Smr family endonuclease
VSLPAAAGQDKLLQLPAGFVNTTQGSAVKATIPHAPIFEVLSRPFTGSAMRNETRGTVVKGGGVKAKHLRDLSAIRAALAEQRRTAEAEAATAARGIRRAEKPEPTLFVASVGVVLPLRKAAPAPPERPRPPARARQRERDEAAALVESISDGFDAETLLDTDDTLSFRRRGIGVDVVRKLRRGVWALQAELDLHGLRRDEARDRLGAFVRDAERTGLRCVRIVHGKGLGSPGREPVLKARVKGWLAQQAAVLAFTHARPADGGHGALIVLLRPGAGRRPG